MYSPVQTFFRNMKYGFVYGDGFFSRYGNPSAHTWGQRGYRIGKFFHPVYFWL